VGQRSDDGPKATLRRAQEVDRLKVSQDADQQPGVELGAPQYLHVLGWKRAQDRGEGAGGQVGHSGVTRYRDETSHMPWWASPRLRCQSEPATCGKPRCETRRT